MENYYERPELSNSQLSAYKIKALTTNPNKAYQLGSRVDSILTEENCVLCEDVEDNFLATKMASSFSKNYDHLLQVCEKQKVVIGQIKCQPFGLDIVFNTRCKFDLYHKAFGGIDLKTTTANSQKQFIDVVEFFDYDRQAAFYMDTAKINDFTIIGISKKAPYSTFSYRIIRDSPSYEAGKRKYQDLMLLKYIMDDDQRL